MTRVYVPTTIERLRAAVAAGVVEPTDDVVVAEADDEESEYAALMTAADASAALVADAGAPGRRVVVVAEIGELDVAAPIELRRVVAVQADVAAQDWGDPAADPDDDLAWFASQELDSLL